MIQYYLDLKNQVKELEEKRLNWGQIQKIYSTSFYISMAVRTPGKTWHLYLGRGGGHEGIWLHDSAPPSQLRRKDNFLEYLRRHLSSCTLLEVKLDSADRIISINYQKYGKIQSLLLFWKARKLYFVHYYQDGPESSHKLLLSWHGRASTVPAEPVNLFVCFDEVGRRPDMSHEFSSKEIIPIGELLSNELKAVSLKGTNSTPGFLQRKKENIENDLRRARQWQKLQTLLDRQDNLEGYLLEVDDQKIKFEGELNPYERRNLVYQKIKKLRRGEAILTQRLQEVTDKLTHKVPAPEVKSELPIIKPVWGKEEATQVSTNRQAHPEYRIFKTDLFHLGIGLSSQGNDQLRSKWASKEDHWFHLDNQKSAHVIVKLMGNHTLTTEVIHTAATILAHFSHFFGDWIPIIHTQVKNLKGVTGAPGMVIYKKEKHLNCPRIDISAWLKD